MIKIEQNKNKAHFSGHETFPLRQLWLRKAFDQISAVDDNSTSQVFSGDDAIVRFGVGKNMVASIKYWGLSCGFIEEITEPKGFKVTEISEALLDSYEGLDPYCEYVATAWYIHWQLAGKGGEGNRSTTWWWIFNHVVPQSFDMKYLTTSLKEFVSEYEIKAAETTLRRDIECCLRSYVPKAGKNSSIEEMTESILGELGLIQHTTRGAFEFKRGPKRTLPAQIFTIALIDFWQWYSPNTATLSFEAIAHEYGSPGRVFKLDENSVADYLMKIDQTTSGNYRWSDTAGMKQVHRVKDQNIKMKLLRKAYA